MSVGKLLTHGLGTFGGAIYLPLLGLDVSPGVSVAYTERLTIIGQSAERLSTEGQSSERISIAGNSGP